ncbi:MAG TPA: isopentenyl transferase family protein, partial [Lentimicrobium sp.]|nr:isopentenyl transferase family protein [Lentimicrobium sp.]
MSRPKSKYLIVITGPTASGKTALAIETALHFGCEIVSADSRQFYRGLETGTAAPDAEQLSLVPHHFIGHLDPEQAYDVSQYEADALRLLNKLYAVSNFVVLTGGSGLYIKAVCEGLDELPAGNSEIREMLRKLLEDEGLPALRTMLRKL